MLTKEILTGILLAGARPEITFQKNDNSVFGNTLHTQVVITGHIDYLNLIQTTLLNYQVTAQFKKKTGRDVLIITKTDNILTFLKLIPDIPDAKRKFKLFKEVMELKRLKRHLSRAGYKRIVEIKEVF